MSYNKFVKKISLPKAQMGVAVNSDYNLKTLYSRSQNLLPVVYQGPTNRIERYAIYDQMEQDPIISTALDVISEYISQSKENEPFKIEYSNQVKLPEIQTDTIEKALDKWVEVNDWKKRIFGLVRDALKFGDIIYIRDPQTKVLTKCNIYDIVGVVVDDEKKPTHYIIKNVDLNVPLKVANNAKNDVSTKALLNTLNGTYTNIGNGTNTQNTVANTSITDPTAEQSMLPVEASNIVHVTMNVDNILIYPFGMSVLEKIYKTYVQKCLLQDCILLYRIKNATEKLVFNIPVGNIPRNKRMQYIERCKNELSQRRMPSKDSDGVFNTIDVAYSSIPFNEDYWLPVDSDGVQPKIEKLAGGVALGEINDLVYWENQLMRGLNVPSSWIPYGPQDGQRTIPTTTAATYIQEQRFFKYCQRIQNIIITKLDDEFKRYLKASGLIVDNTAFQLSFFPPSSITEVTEIEIENSKINLCSAAMNIPYVSKQFALKHYLKLTEEEYNENEKLLMQEMQNVLKDKEVQLPIEDTKAVPGLRSVDISDIPQDFINSTKENLDAQLGGMGGLGGGDIGLGGEEPAGDMGLGGGESLGGGEAGLGTAEPSGETGGAGLNLPPQ